MLQILLSYKLSKQLSVVYHLVSRMKNTENICLKVKLSGKVHVNILRCGNIS